MADGKVKSREGKGLAPGHTTSQWLSRNSNPSLLVPRVEFFSMVFWRVSGGLDAGGCWEASREPEPSAFSCHMLGSKVFDQMVLKVGSGCPKMVPNGPKNG